MLYTLTVSAGQKNSNQTDSKPNILPRWQKNRYPDPMTDPARSTINATCTNTDGWGNKLVTIFARHLDNFILTNKFSLICQIRDFGSGQILQPGQFYLSPGLAKIAPWWLARRDYFLAKVPGLLTGRADAANVYSLNRRAVSCKANLPQVLTIPGLPMHKQEFCSPSLLPSRRCKTHAFLPTRTPPSR
jgi:hypothetical protein